MGFLLVVAVLVSAPFVAEAMRQPMDGRARTQAPGEFLPLPEGMVHVRWSGPPRGPVAVCVHGLTTPSFVWGPIVDGLTQMGFRVLRFDLYGRGFSDRPKGQQDRGFFLHQLQGVLDGMGVQQPCLFLGYSMGGSIVTAYASQNPDKVRQLVLLAPAGLALEEHPLDRFMRKTPLFGDWLALVVAPWLYRHRLKGMELQPSAIADVTHRMADETQVRGFASAVLSSRRAMLAEDTFPDHQELEIEGIPTLAIWGEEDDVIPLRAMGRLAEANRDVEQVMIKGADHGLAYTHPREVMEAIRAFLSRE